MISIPSPCVGICRMDESTGLCLGCARSGEEIAIWRDTGEAQRRRIWAAPPRGRAQPVVAPGGRDHLVQAGLDDRGKTGFDPSDLVLARVHADHPMAAAREAGRTHRSHVSQSHHHDTHQGPAFPGNRQISTPSVER